LAIFFIFVKLRISTIPKFHKTYFSVIFQRKRLLFAVLTLAVLLMSQTGFSQKKKDVLEKKKQENLEKIKELNEMLDKTAVQKEATLGQLNVLKERISSQNRQIDLLTENQQLLEGELDEMSRVTLELNGNLGKLKKEYGNMLYQTSKPTNVYNKLSFLFASESFNSFMLRYKWLKQYTEARRKQAEMIENVKKTIAEEQNRLSSKKQEQDQVLSIKVRESKNLESLKSRQSEVVGRLSKQEKTIRNQVEENRRAVERLESQIARLVEREIRRNEERERAERIARQNRERAAQDREDREERKRNDTPAEKEEEETTVAGLGASFEASRNRLPWPARGFISERFGLHNYDIPGLENVKYDNPGINIQTQVGANVRVVFDGIVRDVSAIQGMKNVVFIQHGDYFTVYSKLASVSVRPGQKITAKDVIGTVAAGNDGTSELQFQIWHNATKLNPENWLMAK
jgi:murein hydrolase activator